MKLNGTISENDVHLFLITDSVDEAVKLIKEKCIKGYGLAPKQKISPVRWLFEHG